MNEKPPAVEMELVKKALAAEGIEWRWKTGKRGAAMAILKSKGEKFPRPFTRRAADAVVRKFLGET